MKTEAILHPVRMRIALVLADGSKLSAQQMRERLKDIPQATLYRHLNKMEDAGVITVIAERRIRGAIEKTYSLPAPFASLSEKEWSEADAATHMAYFMKFLMTVLADFERYVSQASFDFRKDGAGYRKAVFYATDAEFATAMEIIQQTVAELVRQGPGPGRRERTLTTVVTSEKASQSADNKK